MSVKKDFAVVVEEVSGTSTLPRSTNGILPVVHKSIRFTNPLNTQTLPGPRLTLPAHDRHGSRARTHKSLFGFLHIVKLIKS
jgi:hypothetical protein